MNGPRCYAPPLTEEMLLRYRRLIDGVEKRSALRTALEAVYACCDAWWRAPESRRAARTPRGVRPALVPLDAASREALRGQLPTRDDLEQCNQAFEAIDAAADKPLRNAAFHMLWHCVELANGREPMTQETA